VTDAGAVAWPWLAVLGPAPALFDWAVTTFTDRRGSNAVRTASGLLLGSGYGVAVPWFLTERLPWLFAVGLCYGGVATGLLAFSRRRTDGTESARGDETEDHENRSHST
jgi:hypothetical protein